MLLTPELVRRLKHLAVDEGNDLGRLAEPKLWELVGNRYQRHTTAARSDVSTSDPPTGPRIDPGTVAAPGTEAA